MTAVFNTKPRIPVNVGTLPVQFKSILSREPAGIDNIILDSKLDCIPIKPFCLPCASIVTGSRSHSAAIGKRFICALFIIRSYITRESFCRKHGNASSIPLASAVSISLITPDQRSKSSFCSIIIHMINRTCRRICGKVSCK